MTVPPMVKDVLLWLLGKRTRYRIAGHSLYPILRDGQTVYVAKKYRRLAVGDIIIFAHPFRLIHCVKKVKQILPNESILTEGTNVESDDAIGAITPGSIIGIVTSIL